jgi:hypothetical protein
VAKFTEMRGVSDKTSKPDFAAALGLMLIDFEKEHRTPSDGKSGKKPGGPNVPNLGNFVERAQSLFKKFKV